MGGPLTPRARRRETRTDALQSSYVHTCRNNDIPAAGRRAVPPHMQKRSPPRKRQSPAREADLKKRMARPRGRGRVGRQRPGAGRGDMATIPRGAMAPRRLPRRLLFRKGAGRRAERAARRAPRACVRTYARTHVRTYGHYGRYVHYVRTYAAYVTYVRRQGGLVPEAGCGSTSSRRASGLCGGEVRAWPGSHQC